MTLVALPTKIKVQVGQLPNHMTPLVCFWHWLKVACQYWPPLVLHLLLAVQWAGLLVLDQQAESGWLPLRLK